MQLILMSLYEIASFEIYSDCIANGIGVYKRLRHAIIRF